jgi:DNA-directed RNA polymerase specialized sigma24 family protein
LVSDNADRLYAVVLRVCASESDAEEATQETFVRAAAVIAVAAVGGYTKAEKERIIV